MPQSDIDKILAEIKQRKEKAQTVPEEQTVAPPQHISPEEKQTEAAVPVATESQMSEKARNTLSRFINSSSDDKVEKEYEEVSSLDAEFEETEYTAKKSEDYIDENFMKFFTQSVIVTKSPEETNNLQVKKKKGGFFKRKYITDSLSLNIESLEEEEEKKKRKKQRRSEEITKDMPLVKTAGDVYIQSQLKAQQEEATPVSETIEKAVETVVKEKVSRPAPKASNSSLSAILGDDKDPESLAKRILEQRKKAQTLSEESQKKAPVAPRPAKEITKEIVLPVKEDKAGATAVAVAEKQPVTEENSIINSIYTAVIEAQAKDALVADDMTGFIPEYPEDDENEKTIIEQNVNAILTDEEESDEDSVFEEYIVQSEFFNKPEDESIDIVDELLDFRKTLSMRMALGFVGGAVLAYFNMAAANGWPAPAFISPRAQPLLFYIACILVYGLVFVGFLPTIISGFTSIKNAPAPDSFISFGAVLALIQLLIMAVNSAIIVPKDYTIFAPFICLAMAFNAMGKKIATTTIIKNLSLANAPDGINAGYIITDTDSVKRLARTLDEKVPKVLVSRKTSAINNFVQAGFSIHNSDYTARKLAVISWVVTVVCFVMALVISKNIAIAIFCASGAAALQIPLSQTLVNSVPSALMQKSLEKVGALVNGWQGIDQLSKTTHVNFDAKHLFPRGTVILHGIKTFEKERIDLAIIYAASVLINKCDVMRPVFMEVIEGKTDILYPLDSCEYIECQGYVSWINNNRVIVGNRTLMGKYDVSMPPLSLEAKFINQGRKPIYLAVGGKLFGMFVVSYRPDEIVKDNLDKLMDKGVSIMLSSNDFNIDAQLIEDVYEIPADMVSVLNQKEASLLTQFTDYSAESEASVAHLDSLHSLVAGFCGAESAKSAENICSMLQIASVVIGAVLALMFTWSQTIAHLPLLSLLLLSFGFMGLTMLAAFTKKY